MTQEPSDPLIGYAFLASVAVGIAVAALLRKRGSLVLPRRHPKSTLALIGTVSSMLGLFASAVVVAIVFYDQQTYDNWAVIGPIWLLMTGLCSALTARGIASVRRRWSERRDRAVRVPVPAAPQASPAPHQPRNQQQRSGHRRRGGVFVSYRREDASHPAGRSSDHLRHQLGSRWVFTDVDSIEPGADFVDAIERAVSASAAMLVIIGPNWLNAAHPDGRRRLDDPEDFVRREIETGLRRGLRIIPVLIDSTPMPTPAQLPPSLQELARRNAGLLRHGSFGQDASRLTEVVRRILDAPPPEFRTGSPVG